MCEQGHDADDDDIFVNESNESVLKSFDYSKANKMLTNETNDLLLKINKNN
jgi:hypothetical protein